MQENKYRFEDGKIINRATGVAIPDDEPVFVLRASDCRAAQVLFDYATYCKNPRHVQAVLDRQGAFLLFKIEHRDRMKEPDTAPIEENAA